jgi:hypothetical protein
MTKTLNISMLCFAFLIAVHSAYPANLEVPKVVSEKLPNHVMLQTGYAPRNDSLSKFIKTTKITRGKVTLSYISEGWTIEDVEFHAKNVQVKFGNNKLHLPDSLNSIPPHKVRWLDEGFILVPGMSLGGTAHEQYNDTSVISLYKNKLKYLGMVSYDLIDKFNYPKYLYASFAAFDFSPYGGSHADGIGIYVALSITNESLKPDLKETYRINQLYFKQASQKLDSTLAKSGNITGKISFQQCQNEATQSEFCKQKAAVLHYSLIQATLLRYINNRYQLDKLINKLRNSAIIVTEDIDEFNKNLNSFEPSTTSFLFWRKPSSWFINDKES